jgi:hypothetical protein
LKCQSISKIWRNNLKHFDVGWNGNGLRSLHMKDSCISKCIFADCPTHQCLMILEEVEDRLSRVLQPPMSVVFHHKAHSPSTNVCFLQHPNTIPSATPRTTLVPRLVPPLVPSTLYHPFFLRCSSVLILFRVWWKWKMLERHLLALLHLHSLYELKLPREVVVHQQKKQKSWRPKYFHNN